MAIRTSQNPVEVLALPDNGKVRVTQNIIEALIDPDSTLTKIRVSEFVIEVLVKQITSKIGPEIQIVG